MKKNLISLVLMACIFNSCQNDVYDPNYNPNLDARIPENFEWSTTKTLDVNVEVKDEYNGKYYYAVRVYDKTPGEGVLPVAASGKVNKYLPFSQKIVVPATVTDLFIVQAFKKADGSEVIKQQKLAIDGQNITCSFGNSNLMRNAITRAENNGTVVNDGEVYQTSVKDAPGSITVKAGGELKITSGGELDKCVINIEDGGKMTTSDGIKLSLKNSEIHNYGEVRVYDIEFLNGSILYNGDAVEGKNEGGCFYAHDITLINGHGGDKRYLGERSYTSCHQLTLDNVKLTLKTSAWLNCEILSANGGACTLQGEGSTISNTNYIGLATIGQIIGEVKVEQDILVQCANPGIQQKNIVEDATGMIKISGTSCNNGGFGNEEENELGKYTYIIEDMYPQQGDYDMNDVVVSMTAIQKGNQLTIEGELKAVGASYAVIPYIKVNGDKQPLQNDNGQAVEAHAILTGNAETSSLLNTVNGSTHYPAKPFTLKFNNVKEGLNMNDIDFYIIANDNEIHWNTRNQKEKATWGMQIPGLDFKWAQEKVKITAAYPEFTKWFEDSSYPWYNNFKADLIYNPQ